MFDCLGELGPTGRILDIGSSGGSFPGAELRCSVVAIDEDRGAFEGPARPESERRWRVLGQAERLPVASASIDVVVCSHSLEHFVEAGLALDEIGRVLKPGGRLYVSVPNGYGFCDAVYRWVYEGGGHVNRFRRDELIRQIEARAGVRLAEWKKLYSSFVYLPRGRHLAGFPLPGLPARLKRLARLPRIVAAAAHHGLYVGTRLLDRALGTGLALACRRRADTQGAWLPLAFAAGILLAAAFSRINIGVRHILPVYMAFSLVSAAAAVRLLREAPARKWVRYGLLAAAVWFAASSLASHPDYLAYTNELAGSEPEKVLADSDLDWGQDAKRLAVRLKELGAARVAFAPFAVADFVKEHGFPPAFDLSPWNPSPGWNAVSISAWKVARFGLFSEHPEAIFWPDRVKPVERVGKSILLYYFPERPVR